MYAEVHGHTHIQKSTNGVHEKGRSENNFVQYRDQVTYVSSCCINA